VYEDFDFSRLNFPDFKEDSVREALIQPLLMALYYAESGPYKIIRSKTLTHPFIKIGSKKRPIKQIPDYLLEVDGSYAWVLDAKAPDEDVLNHEHQEQIYSYAIHPDVRVKWYALCNGREFILFQIDRAEAVLYFQLSEIAQFWPQLQAFLSPTAFQLTPTTGKTAVKENLLSITPPSNHRAKLKICQNTRRGVSDLRRDRAQHHAPAEKRQNAGKPDHSHLIG
jgi:hypothetical protein